ncbi:UNC-like C-terminal-domain-containing protein [Chaetomium strumarium]|uniref:UNC-like C-terminal-domain-containing protein n=1 Tax=Chaetomium strumarium TaxID=1170767 RepID=A0AAJ0GMM9_9PEZI|nr:UNC-like C-terminal-domain-containing protein [Chaetomium strumarium]
MRDPASWARRIAPALVLLGLHAAGANGSRSTPDPAVTAAPAAAEVCEFRTINYITHTLPQQCLRTSWTSPAPTATDDDNDRAQATVTVTATAASASSGAAQDNATAQEQEKQEELAASSFMSFEEWKEMMLRKSGQDPASIKAHKQREHRERDPAMNNGDGDSFGEEGEISLDFDALAEKVSEIASSSSSSGGPVPDTKGEVKEEPVLYDNGKTQYYRSKDAGKTCKERFSYSSFDAGATVLKTSPGAKNAKAILVENKDSYMLLECRAKNKFVIVELSDDILVDTVVLANFEFFSSMIRKFRVSVSDRYPVKLDKWVELGTFEARNSRDIQAFLIEHPQIYTKYIRVEFLSHWGNEFYCPVSLLRVHGTRMLDTWKEPSHDEEPEQIQSSAQEPVEETPKAQEPAANDTSTVVERDENTTQAVTEMGLTPWRPLFPSSFSLDMCELRSPTTADPTPVDSGSSKLQNMPAGAPDTVTPRQSAVPGADEGSQPGNSSSPQSASPEAPVSQGQWTAAPPSPSPSSPSSSPSTPLQAGNNGTASHPTQRQSETRTDSADGSSSAPTTTSRNKTTSVSASPSASPTVQESFFKTVTKRLQLLESNTSLSLQYIEDQSRFLQEVLLKMERKQITRVDAFLDKLNRTVLSELRSVRTQYEQIWQSTVLALDAQREQSEREIVALTSRLNVLADEVVFQKRMAILQSVLLLSCLVLVIFSRGAGNNNNNNNNNITSLSAAMLDNFPPFPPSQQTSPYNRRYGYTTTTATNRPGSPTEVSSSLPGSPPRSGPDDRLAASALPRRLYSAASFKDKLLPLTPPSEHSRESTPATSRSDRDRDLNPSSPETSFYSREGDREEGRRREEEEYCQEEEREAEEGGEVTPSRQGGIAANRTAGKPVSCSERPEEMSSIEVVDFSPSSSETNPDSQGIIEGEEDGERRESPTSSLRARPALSHLGGVRKPLPALPEDPS